LFRLSSKDEACLNLAYIVDVRYTQTSLEKFTFNSCIIPKHELPNQNEDSQDDIMFEELKGVLNNEPGYIQVFFIPGRYGYKNEGDSEVQGIEYWKQKIREVIWVIQYPLMEEIYNHLFDIEVLKIDC